MCVVVSLFAAVPPPENLHYVQMGMYATEDEARLRQAELSAMGFSPLQVVYEAPWFKVWFGEFEYYLDAHIYMNFIKADIEPGTFVVNIPNKENKNSFSDPISPYSFVFSPPETNISQAPDYVLEFNDALTSPLLPLLDKGEEEGYIPKDAVAARPLIENLIEVLPDTDARKGWAMTRLGVMELQDERFDSARNYFLPIVNGEIKARRLDRIKAMRRVAWTYQIQSDYITAYRAYRELERFTASDLVRAIARVESAGILLVQARCEKGTLDEC